MFRKPRELPRYVGGEGAMQIRAGRDVVALVGGPRCALQVQHPDGDRWLRVGWDGTISIHTDSLTVLSDVSGAKI